MRHATKRRVTVLASMISVLLFASVAFAAWTSTGSGSGTAKSTTSVNSVIAAATSASDLYPGATKSVTVTISNPNDYPIEVTSISAGASELVNGCAAGTVSSAAREDATGLAQTGGGTNIAAQSSGTFTLATSMAGSATDACKSQTFNLPLTATVVSNAS